MSWLSPLAVADSGSDASEADSPHESMEATAGFEPAHSGFADPYPNPLHVRLTPSLTPSPALVGCRGWLSRSDRWRDAG